MTCIVGLIEDGVIYIGGDSAGVNTETYELSARSDPKVFINGSFIFGFTSSFRMGQLLAHALVPPSLKCNQDVYAFMVTDFIDAVRKCLKDGGFAKKKDEEESGGTFLVGYRGRLFSIHDDYQVAENFAAYSACGCGSDLAKGALHATQDIKLTAEKRVQKALMAAAEFSAGVRAPFTILRLPRET